MCVYRNVYKNGSQAASSGECQPTEDDDDDDQSTLFIHEGELFFFLYANEAALFVGADFLFVDARSCC
jgi:hypothetical protein